MKLCNRLFPLFIFVLCLCLPAAEALAQAAAAAPAQPSFTEVLGRMLPMFIIVFFIFYFLVLKPQQAKLKTHQELIASLKKGDTVVTTGGIFGRVAGTEKDYILLELAPNVRVRVEIAHVARRAGEDTNGDKGKSDKASNA